MDNDTPQSDEIPEVEKPKTVEQEVLKLIKKRDVRNCKDCPHPCV